MAGLTVQVPRRRSLRETVSVYSRLGNMKVYIQWLPVLIGWSLVADPLGISATEAAAVLLFMLAALTGASCGGALDHLQGFRDGIDQKTYGAGDALTGYQTKSDASIKPLITGEITDPEARRFGIGIGFVSVTLGTAAILIAPHSPWWLIGLWALWVLASSQYAYGVKLSYYGPADLVLGIQIGSLVAFPVLFLEGDLGWTAAFQAYLIGTLFSQVTLFSMIYDRDADASAGRLTLAVRLSPGAYRILIAIWIVTGWVVAVTGVAVGALDAWQFLAWLPVWAMQVGQLAYGVVRRDALTARLLGWHAFDVAFVTFIAVNLLTS
jgi:1,4-dihydroxy-2-naphthoate octaprenyltransferase